MYCINCGSKLKDGANFCGNCGNSVMKNHVFSNQSSMIQNSEPGFSASSNKKNAIFIAIFCGMVLFTVLIVFLVFIILGSVLLKFEEMEYYTLGDVSVRPFFKVVDEGELCGFKTHANQYSTYTTQEIEVNVCDYDHFQEEVNMYFMYMIKYYGYEEIPSSYYRSIILREKDSNYIIEIDADLHNNYLYYGRYYVSDFASDAYDSFGVA